eukprot:6994998-Heterocapsa_arctica.AAC.1
MPLKKRGQLRWASPTMKTVTRTMTTLTKTMTGMTMTTRTPFLHMPHRCRMPYPRPWTNTKSS